MVRIFTLFFLINLALLGAEVENYRWSNGETYLAFLERMKLDTKKLYYDLDKDDQKVTEAILTGVNYQLLKDRHGNLEQVLIPLNDELQIHLYKKNGSFEFENLPIIAETKREAFTLAIKHSPYLDILRETGSKKVAQIFVASFKNSLNFKTSIQKGDNLAMIYEQKYRLGQPFSMPELKAAMIEMSGKKHYIYLNDDEIYYNEKGEQVEGFLLGRPVRDARISSHFTKRRFHPILKRYRAHLGVDYAAGRGTPILAAGSGRVIFAGFNRGYGNVTKIQHENGYMTVYAHQKSFKVRKGARVKKGQVIGYVGSTGLSTGPHLHFELRKDGVPINPLRVVQVATKKLSGKDLEAFKQLKSNYDQSLHLHLANSTVIEKEREFVTLCYFNNECKDVKVSNE